MTDAPLFFSSDGLYSEFFNSSPHPFDLDGERWPTIEHYFQAQKVLEISELSQKIRAASTPREAFYLGRSVPLPIDWMKIRDEVMRRALYAKFSQNSYLAELLVATGDREIIE
jgi:hypothetical protein